MSDSTVPPRTRPDDVVQVEQLAPLRWRAWSLGLVNPRFGLTAQGARRRATADLDHEWRTGRIPRQQRRLH